MEGVPRRTARLARQFHTAGGLVQPKGQRTDAVPIDEQCLDTGIADLYAGQTHTPLQVATLLKRSVKTVHRIFQHMPGVLPVGNSYLIPYSLFESWMRDQMSRVA